MFKKLKLIAFFAVALWLMQCSDRTPRRISAQMTTDNWKVGWYQEDIANQTLHYTNYVFTFADDGSVSANNGTQTVVGTWATGLDNSDTKFYLNFGADPIFDELNENWDVLENSDNLLKLTHVGNSSGSTDFLNFERN